MKSVCRFSLVLLAYIALPTVVQAQGSSSVAVGTVVVADAPAITDALGIADAPAIGSAAAPADAGQPAGPVPTPPHTGFKALLTDLYSDVKHLPSQNNLWIAAIGGGAALAVHPADDTVTPDLVNASWAHNTFAFGAVMGGTATLLGASVATYGIGRVAGSGKASHVGMDMIQALAIGNLITQTLKYTTQRQRPDSSGANSFPSGHASDTFAIATVLERHAGWKGAIPGYAFASYVAASRLHDNRHYLSDVVFGAAVGLIAGRTVTRHGREIPITVTSVPGGAAIVYVRNGR
jgi:membrane-associated phospholipid phosphatase